MSFFYDMAAVASIGDTSRLPCNETQSLSGWETDAMVDKLRPGCNVLSQEENLYLGLPAALAAREECTEVYPVTMLREPRAHVLSQYAQCQSRPDDDHVFGWDPVLPHISLPSWLEMGALCHAIPTAVS